MSRGQGLRLNLSLKRQDFALRVDLTLPAQGITVIFGPSGSGKTTLLRCVAGLEPCDGLIALGHNTWQDSNQRLMCPTWQRRIGYVFQEASLFEHMNVADNLLYGLRRVDQKAGIQDLQSTIDLLGIQALLKRAIATLSGGERQRAAIARAVAAKPKLLLLDEPLASLDHARRDEVLPWLEKLRDELQLPMLYVTHSKDEMMRLANQVVTLEQGLVTSCGPISEFRSEKATSRLRGVVESMKFDAEKNQIVARVRCGEDCIEHRMSAADAGRLNLQTGDSVWFEVKPVGLVKLI